MSRKGRGSHSRRSGVAREKRRLSYMVVKNASKQHRRAWKGIVGKVRR